MKWLLAALAVGACGTGKRLSTTQLEIHVTDASTHAAIGARVLLWQGGQALHIGSIDLYGQRQGATACQFAPGVVGTWDGTTPSRESGLRREGKAMALVPRRKRAASAPVPLPIGFVVVVHVSVPALSVPTT